MATIYTCDERSGLAGCDPEPPHGDKRNLALRWKGSRILETQVPAPSP